MSLSKNKPSPQHIRKWGCGANNKKAMRTYIYGVNYAINPNNFQKYQQLKEQTN
jgi:hypothetical protein